MRPVFSETTYAFAYTHELVQRWSAHLVGSPTFPTLVAEGAAGGGYDVRLDSSAGFIYMVQFKIAEYLNSPVAREARRFGRTTPYYRMTVRGDPSTQHAELLKHEASGAIVEYASPRLYKPNQLAAAFTSGTVISQSQRVRPSALGPMPDADDHHVLFDPLGPPVEWYSEPKPILRPDAGRITSNGFEPWDDQLRDQSVARQTDTAQPRRPLVEQIRSHTQLLREAAGSLGAASDVPDDPVGELRGLARMHLGVEVFVVAR